MLLLSFLDHMAVEGRDSISDQHQIHWGLPEDGPNAESPSYRITRAIFAAPLNIQESDKRSFHPTHLGVAICLFYLFNTFFNYYTLVELRLSYFFPNAPHNSIVTKQNHKIAL